MLLKSFKKTYDDFIYKKSFIDLEPSTLPWMDFPEVMKKIFWSRPHTVETFAKKEICHGCFTVNFAKYVRSIIFQNMSK